MLKLTLLVALFVQDSELETAAKAFAAKICADPTDLEALFSESFLKKVPAKQLRAILIQVHTAQGSVTSVAPAADGKFRFTFDKGTTSTVTIAVAQGKLTTAWIGPAVLPLKSMDEVIAELKKLPGRVSFQLAKLGDKIEVVAELDAETQLAIGSSFKLYILGALVEDKKRWDEKIPIQEAYRSWPSGVLHLEKPGTEFTVEEMASKMISISDNTATDHLLAHVGRARAEAMMKEMGNAKPERSAPFLATLELFKIKTGSTLRKKYLAADEKERRAMLDGEVRDLARTKVYPLLAPTAIDTLEWFASAGDLVRAMDWLRRKNEATAMKALSINPGLDVPRDRFEFAGYKGGSEPGVLNTTWLLKVRDGGWMALSAGWNDPEKNLEEARFLGILQAAITLIGK